MDRLVPKRLNELQQSTRNAIITALIITKTNPRFFSNEDSNNIRGVLTFTLRDSKSSICNCKFWGSMETVDYYDQKMKIGDVINVENPLVIQNKFEQHTNRDYEPTATIPISLVVNEGNGRLKLNNYQDVQFLNRLQELMFIPHKPISDALRLSDLKFCYMGSDLSVRRPNVTNAQKVDLLVMVAQVRSVRNIRLKNEESQCLDVVVFDQSIPDGMLLTLWQSEWIPRAQQYWESMKTVLFLIDVDVQVSTYHKSLVLQKSVRTIIYENPHVNECSLLRDYAIKHQLKAQQFDAIGQLRRMDEIPNASDIQTVMTVRQIYMHMEHKIQDDTEKFTAVLYAMITKFNIDGYYSIIGRKCKTCQRIVKANAIECDSENCQAASSMRNANWNSDNNFDFFYNLNVHFGDHTGTLVEARLTDLFTESVFGISAANFESKFKNNDRGLEDLKWSYLFKRFKVKLFIKKPTETRRNASMLVVDMQATNCLEEIANNIIVR